MGILNIFKRAKTTGNFEQALVRGYRSDEIMPVTEREALTLGAVFAAVRVPSEDLASLSLRVYRETATKQTEDATDHPLYRVLRFAPNEWMDSSQFFERIMANCLLRGNFYGHIIRNMAGEVAAIDPLDPAAMSIKWIGDQRNVLRYEYTDPRGQSRIFEPSEILHIRGISTHGIKGVDVITLMARTARGAIEAEVHGVKSFENGLATSGAFQHPGKLTDEAVKRLRKSLDDQVSGARKMSYMVLEQGLNWINMGGLTNEQAQYLQTRQFSITDIARWFRVPPHLIGDLTHATFSNIEHQSLDYVQHTLTPWAVRIERAIIRQLLRPEEWGKVHVKFRLESLLRGDTPSRYNAYATGLNAGFLNIDEVREKEDYSPLPDQLGQKHYRPLNMTPIGEAPPGEDDDANALPPDPAVAERVGRIVGDRIVKRCIRREQQERRKGQYSRDNFGIYLRTELEPLIEAVSYGDRPSRENLIDATRSVIAEWCERSDQTIDAIERWEETRSGVELDRLVSIARMGVSNGSAKERSSHNGSGAP